MYRTLASIIKKTNFATDSRKESLNFKFLILNIIKNGF